MLEKLLTIINQGGTLDLNTLADKLDTSPELVKMMLDQLAAMGRLSNSEFCAGAACGGCSLSDACSSKTDQIHLWKYQPEKNQRL